MVSLWKNPSGEVTLTSVPVVTATAAAGGAGPSAEDVEKIRELRNIISSLRSELKTVSIIDT